MSFYRLSVPIGAGQHHHRTGCGVESLLLVVLSVPLQSSCLGVGLDTRLIPTLVWFSGFIEEMRVYWLGCKSSGPPVPVSG
ncbi:hypothetical protein SAMN05444167_1786 [Terriglobus roseus]|uniref:Uncharacterized protein n=1 Tax=Terriglobus roseus TaxID=392734 RepID=A0A1G7JE21_9BACT|nr:hypothetical protein SAMN05444167_1786 [Terriglobus roseus]